MYKDIRERNQRKKLNKIARKSKIKPTGKVGITVRNTDILKIDYKDMFILTLAMIPFFIALNCIFGIRTFDIKVLNEMRYAFTLSPIVSAFIVIPIVYLAIFYLKNKDAVNRKSFLKVGFGTIMLVLILSEVRRYLSTLVLFSVPGYFVITLIALVTVIYYLIKINKVFRFNRILD